MTALASVRGRRGPGQRTTASPSCAESLATAGLTYAGRLAMDLIRRVEIVIAGRHASVLDDPPERWRGRGPVVLVGGYGATDPVMAPLAGWLDHLGFQVEAFTAGAGVGCADQAADALAAKLRDVARRSGGAPLRLVGHSRGGQFARVAAGRVLGEVEIAGLVTLGTPFDPRGVRWPVLAQVTGTALVGSLGAPGLFTWGCLYGRCCAGYRRETRAPWPSDIPFTSVYGRRDAAVPRRSSIDPYARNVEIDGGHLALLTSPTAFAATADGLSADGVDPAPTSAT